jgi:hypothetical protein
MMTPKWRADMKQKTDVLFPLLRELMNEVNAGVARNGGRSEVHQLNILGFRYEQAHYHLTWASDILEDFTFSLPEAAE